MGLAEVTAWVSCGCMAGAGCGVRAGVRCHGLSGGLTGGVRHGVGGWQCQCLLGLKSDARVRQPTAPILKARKQRFDDAQSVFICETYCPERLALRYVSTQVAHIVHRDVHCVGAVRRLNPQSVTCDQGAVAKRTMATHAACFSPASSWCCGRELAR